MQAARAKTSELSRLRPGLAALLCATAGAALASSACDTCSGHDTPKDASAVVDAPSASAPASSAPLAAGDASPTPSSNAAALSLDAAAIDGGASACRLAYGPAEQTFRGPAAMVMTDAALELVANDGGKPRIFSVPLRPPPRSASAPPVMPPSPSSFVGMRWPPCEMAGKWAYCQAAGGSVYRTTLGATDTKLVAKSHPSTRIAAASLGPDHAVVGTLDTRRTSEGMMTQAFITLDDGETTRLSEEGAGATVLRLVPRGANAVAIYLDARTAMAPLHARPMSLRDKELALAEDAVVFVGGPPERGIEVTVAGVGHALFALLPMAYETSDFGMAAVPIADKPKDDVQPIWSPYPNGLDPAPIGATISAHVSGDGGGAGAAWVARVRPAERAATSPRVLELGRLDAAGVFASLGPISTGKNITDIAMAVDTYGAVWILYGDTSSTWLERRVCP